VVRYLTIGMAFIYMIKQYGTRLLVELDLAIFTIGFLITVLLCITVMRGESDANR
jgi:hypothetical protein